MTGKPIKQALEAAKHPNLLETTAQLTAAERSWSACSVVGIDTEFVRERTYRAGLGLVQISDGKTAWLWDPLRFKDCESIRRLLQNHAITKVLHSASEDLEVLQHAMSAAPEPLVDTQIACAMLGQPLQLSLQGAAAWLFDVALEKEHTRSNWLKRPLEPGQLHYAAMDVVLLPAMLEKLKPRLEAAGRWQWLQEDVRRLQRVSTQDSDPDLAYQRIRGAGRLAEADLRILRSLARWREQTAATRDRARGFVVADAALLELARAKPRSAAELRSIEQLHPGSVRRYEGELLQAIGRGLADRSPIERIEPLNAKEQLMIKKLRNVVQRRAEALGVDPALLASRRELEKLLRSGSNIEAIPERFLGWRRAVITDELLKIMG